MLVEADLGRLSGTEDDLTDEEYEAKLTDVTQAQEFIEKTGIDALAVCIGNVHGKYPASGPNLRLDLLEELHAFEFKKQCSIGASWCIWRAQRSGQGMYSPWCEQVQCEHRGKESLHGLTHQSQQRFGQCYGICKGRNESSLLSSPRRCAYL